MIHLAIRGYVSGEVLFEEQLTLFKDRPNLEGVIAEAAKRHVKALDDYTLHMVEIELLDEPDPLRRFHRFGSEVAPQ